MTCIRWQALNTCDFGLYHVSLTEVNRPLGFSIDHSKRGRGTSGILLITEGSLSFQAEGQPELTAGENALCLLPQACRYRLRFTGESNRLLLLNFSLVSPLGEPIIPGSRVELLSSHVMEPKLLRFFQELSDFLSEEGSDSSFRQKEYVYRLLSLLFEENAIDRTPQAKYANLSAGVHLLHQTFLEELPISCFAQACSISPSSFRSLFTQFYGVSPLRYRNQLRINHARHLLTERHCTVLEAAEASGFNSLGYFCRLYKKATGETPGQTRSRHIG